MPRDDATILHGQAVEQAPSDEATPSWEYMGEKARAAYYREHGVGAPGYRATGSVDWFPRHHPDTASCVKCREVTDRWVIGRTWIGFVEWGEKHIDQPMAHDKKLALCGEPQAFCQRCEDLHSIAVLQQRQGNMNIYPALRAREADDLAELEVTLGPKERAA